MSVLSTIQKGVSVAPFHTCAPQPHTPPNHVHPSHAYPQPMHGPSNMHPPPSHAQIPVMHAPAMHAPKPCMIHLQPHTPRETDAPKQHTSPCEQNEKLRLRALTAKGFLSALKPWHPGYNYSSRFHTYFGWY